MARLKTLYSNKHPGDIFLKVSHTKDQFIGKFYRKFGALAQAFSEWIDSLPEEKYKELIGGVPLRKVKQQPPVRDERLTKTRQAPECGCVCGWRGSVEDMIVDEQRDDQLRCPQCRTVGWSFC